MHKSEISIAYPVCIFITIIIFNFFGTEQMTSSFQDISKLMNNVSGTRWGNKFGMMLLPIYYHKGGSNPLEFLKRAKSMIDKKKLSLEAPCSYKLGHFVMSFFGAKVTFCPTQLNCKFSLHVFAATY